MDYRYRPLNHWTRQGALIGTAIGVGLLVMLTAPGVASGQTSPATATVAPTSNVPQVMTVAVESAPSDLDPASSYDENSDIPLRAFYEGLVTLKGSSLTDYVPVLAQTIDDQNNQHQVYTFKLQPNVTFHDGTPFDATAAKFGIQRTITDNLGTGAILGTFFADANGNDQSSKLIQVVDPLTLKVSFPRPQPFFLIALAASYGTGFVSPTAVKQHTVTDPSTGKPDDAHIWLKTHEDGTGPYQLVGTLSPDAPTVLQQYPKYWRGWSGTHLTKIQIEVVDQSGLRRQGLESNSVDAATVLLPQDIAKLQKEGGYQFNLDPKNSLRVDFLVMAASYGPLQNKLARQGMAYAFDYAAYNRGQLGGLGAQPTSPFPSTLLGFDSSIQPFPTDLKMASQLLNQGGVPQGQTFTLAAQEGRGDIAGAILKQQLEQLGYNLVIKKYSSDDYNNLLAAGVTADRPDFFLQTWWPDYNSPLNYSFPLFYSKSAGAAGQNAGYYTDSQVDQIIEKAQQTADQTQLLASFKSLQQIVYHDDPAGIFMAQSPEFTVVSSHVQGQIFNALYLGTFDFYALSKS